jgi:hypothetical protein
MSEQRCETCRFWLKVGRDGRLALPTLPATWDEYGVCRGIDVRTGTAAEPRLAFICGYEDDDLHTLPAFGCVLHEPRP